MRRVSKYITHILALFIIYALSSFSSLSGQTLNVFILYGENAVTDVEACQGSTVALTVEVYGGSGTGHTYTWSGDINPLYFNDLGDLVSYKNTTPSGTYNLTVDVTDDGGFSGSASVTVVIKPSPLSDIVANGPTTFCEGDYVELEETNGQTDVTYQWQRNFSNISGATNYNYNAYLSGNYRVRVSGSNGCSKLSGIISVTANAAPTAPTGSDLEVCYDGVSHNASATAPAGTSVVWYNAATGGSVTVAPSGTTAGIYTAWAESVDDITACVSSTRTQVTLTINALPSAPTGSNVVVCYDGASHSASATAPSGSSVVWYTAATGGSVTTAPTGTAAGVYTAWAESVNNTSGCVSSTRTQVTLTINALPSAPTGSNVVVCYDGASHSASATAPSGSSVVWYTAATGGSVTTAPTGTAAGVYTAWAESVNNTSGCVSSTRTQVTLTINALPSAPTGSNVVVCYDGASHSASATAPSGSSVVWYTAATGGSVTTAPTGTAAGVYTAWAESVNNTSGCVSSTRTQVTLTINALPSAPTGSNVVVCYDGASHSASATAPSGSSVVWYTAATGGSVTTAPTGTAAGVYTAWAESVNNTSGCVSSTRTQVTLTINTLPAAPTGSDVEVCYDGASHSASATAPAGASVVWYDAATGGNVTTAPTGTTVGTYTAWAESAYGASGCVSETRTEVTLTINPLPTQFSVTGGGNYCFGDAGALVGLSDSEIGVSYTLYKDGAPTTTVVAGTGNAISFGPQTTGTYTVYAQIDATGCTQVMSGSAVASEIPAIVGNSISADQIICSGTVPAQLTGPIPTGGSGSYSYRWQKSTTSISGPFTNITGATGQSYSPGALSQTTYYRRIVTSGSCISISNVLTITVNPVISNNTITADQSICYNTAPSQLDGSSPSGGSGSYTYIWQSSTAGAAGPFSDVVGATDINYQPGNLTQDTWFRRIVLSPPCSDNISNTVLITVSPEFSVSSFTSSDPTCNGYANGSATANLTGGTAPFIYSWNTTPEQTTQTATGLSAGVNYIVTVTDASLCVAIGNITLTEPAAIALLSVTPTDVTGCYGDTNGAIQIEGAGGTTNYTYSLYEGATLITSQTPVFPAGANFTGLGAGSYSVSITDVNSCPAYTENNIVVSEPTELVISDVQTTSISCAGYSDGTITIIASGGTGALEYTIDGLTYQASNVFAVGEGYYDISVRDANGCSTSWPIQIEMVDPSAISFNYEITNITTCNGDNSGKISISNVAGGSETGYEYSIYIPEAWGLNSLFENLPGGATNPYYIKVKDSYGCIEVGNNGNPIYINQPAPISFNVVTTDVTTCWYNTNGTIKINSVSGGTGSKQVSIDGVTYYPTTKTFNVGVGSYTVYVRDANGCIATKSAVVSGPPAIVIDAVTITDATCFGASNGEFDATASGGTPPLEYSIDGVTYQATGLFTGLVGGTYTLNVRDANGCVLDQDVVVGQPPVLYFSQQDVAPITCNGANDGEITLTAAGGNAPYSYSITGGAPYSNTTGTFTGLSAATYTVAVLDNNGCEVLGDDLTVTEPDPISITSQASTDILCFGESNGTISVTATGGTNPLVYSLLDAGSNVVATSTDGNFTGVALGTYTVAVDDAHYCGPVVAGPFTISQPALLDFTYTTVDLTCYNDGTGEISVNATGGIAPYEYSFDGGVTIVGSNILGGLNGGDYTVIVRDANSCETSQVVTIIAPAELIISLDVTNISCSSLADGQIVANVSGGNTSIPYQYRIDGGAWQASNTFTGLSDATYFIEAIDASGCIIGDNASIVAPTAISIDNVTPVNPTCTSKGSITVEASGGTGILTYTLNPGAIQTNTTGVFNDLDIGTYTVDIIDANGCGPVTSAPIVLSAPALISLDDVIVTDVTGCYGNNDGTITVVASGGTVPLQYSIDNGVTYQASNAFTGLSANTYEVVVNDVNNCPQNSTVTISQPVELVITGFSVVQETTAGSGDGSISVTASGGTGVLTYTLQPIGTVNNTGIFNGLGAGTYQVVVTDENGCTVQTGDLVISGVSIVVTPTMVSCHGLSDGQILVSITGGFPPFSVNCTQISEMNSMTVTNPNPGEYLIEGLPADTFMISITDATLHAFPNRQVIITEPDTLVASFNNLISPACHGVSDGSVEFNITGGTPDYTITWDGGSSVGNIATNVGVGTHIFTITDSNGCIATVNDVPEIVEPDSIEITEFVKTDLTCNGQPTGRITVTATGGTGTFTYVINGPVNDATNDGLFVNLPAGSYTLSITDGNGCSAVVDINPIELTEPTPMLITGEAYADSLVCPNSTDGYVQNVNVTGGTPDYTYLWSNGKTTKDVTGLTVGTYTLYVTDANYCIDSAKFNILGPDSLILFAQIDSADCRHLWFGTSGGTEIKDFGAITINSSIGGNGSIDDFTFLWNYPTDNPSTERTLSNISGGIYELTVTDKKECVYTFNYTVPVKFRYNYFADAGKDTTVCYNNPVELQGAVWGGASDLTFAYDWFLVPETAGEPLYQNTDKITIQLTDSQTYMLRVIDSDSACFDETTVTLSAYPEIGLEVPLYISAVQDTIISVLMGKEFNMDVIVKDVSSEINFQWKPAEMFIPSNSWNSTLIYNDEIKNQISSDRFVTLQDPITRRRTEFILVDVIATTEMGCTDSIRLYTKVVNDLAFGNVFSPNGDGINDVWSVPKDYLFPDLEIEIFNRWGSLVWSAKGDKAVKGWNGRTNSGHELPIGTYYYVVKFNAKAQGASWKPVTGSVTIVK
ncbi:MAG: gliding motility-associated C-terminal domain-containing protein [Bacteroidales bacterium]